MVPRENGNEIRGTARSLNLLPVDIDTERIGIGQLCEELQNIVGIALAHSQDEWLCAELLLDVSAEDRVRTDLNNDIAQGINSLQTSGKLDGSTNVAPPIVDVKQVVVHAALGCGYERDGLLVGMKACLQIIHKVLLHVLHEAGMEGEGNRKADVEVSSLLGLHSESVDGIGKTREGNARGAVDSSDIDRVLEVELLDEVGGLNV